MLNRWGLHLCCCHPLLSAHVPPRWPSRRHAALPTTPKHMRAWLSLTQQYLCAFEAPLHRFSQRCVFGKARQLLIKKHESGCWIEGCISFSQIWLAKSSRLTCCILCIFCDVFICQSDQWLHWSASRKKKSVASLKYTVYSLPVVGHHKWNLAASYWFWCLSICNRCTNFCFASWRCRCAPLANRYHHFPFWYDTVNTVPKMSQLSEVSSYKFENQSS